VDVGEGEGGSGSEGERGREREGQSDSESGSESERVRERPLSSNRLSAPRPGVRSAPEPKRKEPSGIPIGGGHYETTVRGRSTETRRSGRASRGCCVAWEQERRPGPLSRFNVSLAAPGQDRPTLPGLNWAQSLISRTVYQRCTLDNLWDAARELPGVNHTVR